VSGRSGAEGEENARAKGQQVVQLPDVQPTTSAIPPRKNVAPLVPTVLHLVALRKGPTEGGEFQAQLRGAPMSRVGPRKVLAVFFCRSCERYMQSQNPDLSAPLACVICGAPATRIWVRTHGNKGELTFTRPI